MFLFSSHIRKCKIIQKMLKNKKIMPDYIKSEEFKKLYILTCAILIVFSLGNMGVLLNFKAIQKNSGKMPVLSDNYKPPTDTHFYYTDFSEVNLPYLTDIIKLPFGTLSIGDILIYTCVITLIILLEYLKKIYERNHI